VIAPGDGRLPIIARFVGLSLPATRYLIDLVGQTDGAMPEGWRAPPRSLVDAKLVSHDRWAASLGISAGALLLPGRAVAQRVIRLRDQDEWAVPTLKRLRNLIGDQVGRTTSSAVLTFSECASAGGLYAAAVEGRLVPALRASTIAQAWRDVAGELDHAASAREVDAAINRLTQQAIDAALSRKVDGDETVAAVWEARAVALLAVRDTLRREVRNPMGGEQ